MRQWSPSQWIEECHYWSWWALFTVYVKCTAQYANCRVQKFFASWFLGPLVRQGQAKSSVTSGTSCDLQELEAVGYHSVSELPETVSVDDVTITGPWRARQLNTNVAQALDHFAPFHTRTKRQSIWGSQWLSPAVKSAQIKRRRLGSRYLWSWSYSRSRAFNIHDHNLIHDHKQISPNTDKRVARWVNWSGNGKDNLFMSKVSDNPRLLWSILRRPASTSSVCRCCLV